MNVSSTSLTLREGDTVTTEWSKVSYDRWCAESHAQYTAVPGMRLVNIYEIVDSVIENDLSDTERTAVILHHFEGKSKRKTAQIMGTSYSNAHAALKRAEKKLHLILKHFINCEEYMEENSEF
ncbi:MAG: sigma-70 region 4 domain-containing protein [Clostridia bacterium]|nr:sigma-70 region 4 domain-containing protein [Clostridia bacterium]